MSRVTRFAARDPGPGARLAGFMAHLRANGLRLGVGETETALAALCHVEAGKLDEVRRALKAVCSGSADEARGFDALFDGYWLNGGRVREKTIRTPPRAPAPDTRSTAGSDAASDGDARPDRPDEQLGDGTAESRGAGRMVASSVEALSRTDLRELVDPGEIARAEIIARRLAAAIRDRRSRRRRAARKGDRIDFRKVVRRSLATGGEPLDLPRRRRPERPVRLSVLVDVSGSMKLYAQIFLAFVGGLMRGDDTADAYLFHTRLVRITEALRDDDSIRALNRLSLLADGFGGGSEIAGNLDRFARGPARRLVTGRSVVIILSDGYDTAPPEAMGPVLARLRQRGCRIIWLNPLLGWKDYTPVARSMAAARPHLDLFAPANTLESLAALEAELARI